MGKKQATRTKKTVITEARITSLRISTGRQQDEQAETTEAMPAAAAEQSPVGVPLDPETRGFMQRRFGHDFSQVRIHTDERSAVAARELNANAFTRGQDIFFAAGLYRPHTIQGQQLLAHELTHTLQQRRAYPPAPEAKAPMPTIGQQHDSLEREADRAARRVASGHPVPLQSISLAALQAQGMIARQAATNSAPVTSPAQTEIPPTQENDTDQYPDKLIAALVERVLHTLQRDPDDLSGSIRSQLRRLNPATRDTVLAGLQTRTTAEDFERLNRVLASPAPVERQNDTSSDALTAAPPAPVVAETPAPPAVEAPAAMAATRPEVAPETVQPAVEVPPTVEQEAAPAQEAPTEEKAVTTLQEAAPITPTETTAHVEGEATAQAAIPATGDMGTMQPATTGEPSVATSEEGGAQAPAQETPAPAAETAVAQEAAPEVSGGPQSTTAEAADTSAIESAVAEPTTETAEPAAEEPAEVPATQAAAPEEVPAEPPEMPVPSESTSPAAQTEPAAPVTEEPVETAPAEEVAPEPSEQATEAPTAEPASDMEQAGEIEQEQAVQEASPVEAPGSEAEGTTGQTESESGSTAKTQPGQSTQAAGPALMPPVVETSDDIATPGGGGGGGSPIQDPPAPQVPDVSQAEPTQALAQVGSLPPAQLQSALGGVSASASRSVNTQRAELAANAPQMERPSGVPTGQAAPETPTDSTPTEGAKTPQQVERVPAGPAAPPVQPVPVPPQPQLPTQSVTPPPVKGNAQGQESAVDVQQLQSSVQSLPTHDPALTATAGTPPPLVLEGNADPARVQEQRTQLEQSTTQAHMQAQQEAAQPMGEQHILPDVPQETLQAEIPSSAGGGNAPAASNGAASTPTPTGTAPASGTAAAPGAATAAGGEGDNSAAASIIAQQQRGDEIRASVAQARGDMNVHRQKQQTQAAEARANAQRDIDQQVNQNAQQQTQQRTDAQREVQKQRGQWTEAQSKLVDTARVDADTTYQKGEQDITTRQDQVETQANKHIEDGNNEITEARNQGEQEAARERNNAQEESQSSGVLSWLANQARAFFDRVKGAIQRAFEQARAAVRSAIQKAQKLASDVIDGARRSIVGIIQWAGDKLIAIGDRVLAGIPALRDRFHHAIEERVNQAVSVVNALADRLKEGVQRALNFLGAALDAALGLLEKGLLAAVDSVNKAVQNAISFADSVMQTFATFAALIKDIAANPGQWLRNLGASIMDGIRNHLWKAFKRAIKAWFNQKVEEVLGLGLTIWNILRGGGITLAQIGPMAWEAIKQAIPMALLQILIEKLVSMLIPAAGAVMAIIEGLQAAWGTVQRILQAIQRFIVFLKAVKTGNAGPPFAEALAAAAIAVIDFVANWLLKRLRGPASAVAGRIRAIAQKIGQRLGRVFKGIKQGITGVGRGIKAAGQGIVSGVKAVGRGIVRGVKAVGRGLKAAGRAIAGSRVAQVLGRAGRAIARSRLGHAIARGYRAVRQKIQRAREKFRAWRERRRQQKEERNRRRAERERRRQEAAFETVHRTLERRLRRGLPKLLVRGLLAWLKIRHRFKVLKLEESQSNFQVIAGFSPTRKAGEGDVIKPKEEVEKESDSGPHFLFRGDDYYRGGPVGFELDSKEAEEADIQTFAEHVLEKKAEETSRYTSYSITKGGTATFTKKNRVLKVTWDVLLDLQKQQIIRIYTPEDVERLMLGHSKAKVRRIASDVRHVMENHGEVLIEGRIPAEILRWAK